LAAKEHEKTLCIIGDHRERRTLNPQHPATPYYAGDIAPFAEPLKAWFW